MLLVSYGDSLAKHQRRVEARRPPRNRRVVLPVEERTSLLISNPSATIRHVEGAPAASRPVTGSPQFNLKTYPVRMLGER